jgi:hypothetical protein
MQVDRQASAELAAAATMPAESRLGHASHELSTRPLHVVIPLSPIVAADGQECRVGKGSITPVPSRPGERFPRRRPTRWSLGTCVWLLRRGSRAPVRMALAWDAREVEVRPGPLRCSALRGPWRSGLSQLLHRRSHSRSGLPDSSGFA